MTLHLDLNAVQPVGVSTVPLGQFYTDPKFSTCLIGEFSVGTPRGIVDIGAGRGSLSQAAMLRWQATDLATVENDDASYRHLQTILPSARHLHADALRPDLPERVRTLLRSVDVAVCNPPFGLLSAPTSLQVLAGAGMPEDWPDFLRNRAEITFLAQNLRLLEPGGELGIILPASFASGLSFRPFRQWLLGRYFVRKVIQLPPVAFARTQTHAHVFIIENRPPVHRHEVMLARVDVDGKLSEASALSLARSTECLDAGRNLALSDSRWRNNGNLTLAGLGADIRRGLPVAQLKEMRGHFFHTTDFKHSQSTVRFPSGADLDNHLPIARTGDVLIGRVGRNCHQQTVVVTRGAQYFSDCVLRIRVAPAHRGLVRESLTSDWSKRWRKAFVHGVGPSVLCKEDLVRHPVIVNSDDEGTSRQ